VQELLTAVSQRLHQTVSFDGCGWHATDPATLLVTQFGLRSNPQVALEPMLENELLEDDVAKFADLARRRRPVASISGETDGDVRRSPRMRKLLMPRGVHDELRAALVIDRACWGVVCLLRSGESAAAFTEGDARFVAELVPHIAEGLRTAITAPRSPTAGPADAEPTPTTGPGTVLIGPGRSIVSVTRDAEALLDELVPDGRWPTEAPALVRGVITRARSRARGLPGPVPRVRVHTRCGRWLEIHASVLEAIDDRSVSRDGQASFSVVIQPAAAHKVAPLLLEAYGLSIREQEVVGLLLRGLTTPEIARTLHISAHTVRDHVKAIFAITGVSRRGELAARLYLETLPR
jgi:DNA-binding CsgD family transcriptional regulator